MEQPELGDPDFQNKLDSILQEGSTSGYRPSSSITTIHENEVSSSSRQVGSGPEMGQRTQVLRLSETPLSMSSLSPRSSLSSLSPPCSPLVTDASFLSGEAFSGPASQLDLDLQTRLMELRLEEDHQQSAVESLKGTWLFPWTKLYYVLLDVIHNIMYYVYIMFTMYYYVLLILVCIYYILLIVAF